MLSCVIRREWGVDLFSSAVNLWGSREYFHTHIPIKEIVQRINFHKFTALNSLMALSFLSLFLSKNYGWPYEVLQLSYSSDFDRD